MRAHSRTKATVGMALLIIMFVGSLACGNLGGGRNTSFVSMNGNAFALHGQPFFPLVVNYIVSLRATKDSLWASPNVDYSEPPQRLIASRSMDLEKLRSDMQLIKDMGFNSVRLVGFGETFDRSNGLCVKAKSMSVEDTFVCLTDGTHYEQYLKSMGDIFNTINACGLKTIMLVTIHPEQHTTEQHFIRLADRFNADTSILAWDLFNEPLYFDSLERPKRDVPPITHHWRELMREHAPHQLCTIGLTGIREVFEWDPNMLDVDFISFHPYEYETEQVRNEMRWYHENVRTPWIIGETAIAADNDSVSYDAQRDFARKTMRQALACGAIGYSWWQYKDVDWNYFHSDFMGVVNRKGSTRTSGGLAVQGTPKPVAEEFKNFDPQAARDECADLPNYYNYSGHNVSRITGRLVDGDGTPIAAGVVLGWNEFWSHSYHTISKADGTFELRGDFYFFHWMASASTWTMVRADCKPNAYLTGKDGIPTMFIGDLVLEKLKDAR